jgi:hypothetical protein
VRVRFDTPTLSTSRANQQSTLHQSAALWISSTLQNEVSATYNDSVIAVWFFHAGIAAVGFGSDNMAPTANSRDFTPLWAQNGGRMTIAITLLDTRTGQQTTITEDWDSLDAAEFYWEEGNGSCDCSRRVVLGEAPSAVECGDELIEVADIRAS